LSRLLKPVRPLRVFCGEAFAGLDVHSSIEREYMSKTEIYHELNEIFIDLFSRALPLTPALSARDVEGRESIRRQPGP
jgi:hypothetical protein